LTLRRLRLSFSFALSFSPVFSFAAAAPHGAQFVCAEEGGFVHAARYPNFRELWHLLIREQAPNPYGPTQPISSGEWSDAEIVQIRSILRRLTARRIRNDHDAEDLVQETLLTMMRKLPGTELQKGLLVWALGILRRKIGNYYKMIRKYGTLDSDHVPARDSVCLGSMNGVQESRLHYKELRAIVDSLLQSLPRQERRALELLLRGLRTHEIAAEMSPERYQNVANHLHRGRKKVSRALAKYGYLPVKTPRLLKAGRRKPANLPERESCLK
jgi:RNA polymerase sigma factor (sigma-70 family)